METYKKIGFIGAGNMGEAIIGALIQAGIFSSSMIYASDASKERLDIMKKTYGINVTDDNIRLFSESNIVILAVKPQQMNQVLSDIASDKNYQIKNRKLIISIAAGIPIKKIENLLYSPLENHVRENLPIVRVMPNTPALVLAGMSGMSSNSYANSQDIQMTHTILKSMGKVLEFKEDDLDAVTALSGSGPAYVFYLIESMIEAGIKVGLKPDEASVLTIATLEGAVKLIKERNESAQELRRKVTSPGGTTEAAIKVMEKNSVKQSIIAAIEAATLRSRELKK